MPVMINEMEISPAAEPQNEPGPARPKGDAGAAQQDPVKLVHKTLHVTEQRSRRLEAY
jgi:hypothetical protein